MSKMSTYSDMIVAPAMAVSALLRMDKPRLRMLAHDYSMIRAAHRSGCSPPIEVVDSLFLNVELAVDAVWLLSGRSPYHRLDHTAKGRVA